MDQPLSVSHSAPGHPPADSTKKRRHLWIWVIILVLFALLFCLGMAGSTARARQRLRDEVAGGAMAGAVPVTVATATKGSIGVYLDAIGTVTPIYTDSITAQVTGVITAVHYREGQSCA